MLGLNQPSKHSEAEVAPLLQGLQSLTLSDTLPASRLILLKLVLINFKSYGGRSFSSVVGPNGSGKSNVIDSLLFVFGFKAKKLRQGKLGDLIHNSASMPNLTSCEVQVHFALFDDKLDAQVPDSEFCVSRAVRKTGPSSETSSYYLDGKSTTYQRVQDLLKGYGVDLDHKRFLILQVPSPRLTRF
ncbi:hypothetical protein HDU91_002369 [Kappamyces sp. JEL0680]|nr:hypothetical protein HDU91_002369 [Kappamyces sp. JEL0680]